MRVDAAPRVLTGGIAATVATATLDPDRLLWVPGQKTIFDLGAAPRAIELPGQPFTVALLLDDIARRYATAIDLEAVKVPSGLWVSGQHGPRFVESVMGVGSPEACGYSMGRQAPGRALPALRAVPGAAFDGAMEAVAVAPQSGLVVRVVQYDQLTGSGMLTTQMTDYEVVGRLTRERG